ncbi:MAG: VanZ family protein [Planctomycetota bacterium]
MLCYWTALAFGTHNPRLGEIPQMSMFGVDKVVHFLAYAGLAFFMRCAIKPVPGRGWAVLVLCSAYGAVDELTQPLFNRTCDPFDWIANVAGVTTVCVIWRIGKVMRDRRRAAAGFVTVRSGSMKLDFATSEPARPDRLAA